MLSPAMATMLAVLTTDAAVEPARAAAGARTPRSRDRSTASVVDGCTSTNDTVLVLANGAPATADRPRDRAYDAFVDALTAVCAASPTRWPPTPRARPSSSRIVVRGARSDAEAQLAARARWRSSQLVQCSLNGDDPYWGRVLSELGASGACFDPEQVDIVVQRRHRVPRRHRARARRGRAGAASMAERDIEIACDLHAGPRRGDDAHHRPLARVHRREPGTS